MTNARSIQGIIVLICALVAAIWLGLSIVTNQTETIIQIIGIILVIICFAMGKRIWLLIPFTSALAISLRIPGQPDTMLLGQLLFIGFSIPMFLMRKLPYKFEFTEIECLILLLTLFVAQVYLRNPVGVSLIGTDSVGGKAYIIYSITLIASLILCGLRVNVLDLKWLLRLSIVGGVLNLFISVVGALIPTVGYYTGASFNRSDEVNYENHGKAIDAGAATRAQYLGRFGSNLAVWISSFKSPLLAAMNPLWLMLIILAFVVTMLSGFRSGLMATGGMFIIGIAYRSGKAGLLVSIIGGAGFVSLLAVVNLMIPLPPNIQRTLSFLPGTWDQRQVQDGQDSTEWRVEIWKEVLFSDRWIENKWLGDGLGFSAAELAGQLNERKGARAGLSGFDSQREGILSSGDYHSGPVQTVRVIGYAGLAMLVWFQLRIAVLSHRQIQRCRGTPWFPLALLIGIPSIWFPFQFILIFGTFKDGAAALLLTSSIIRILQNNLPLPAWVGSTNRTSSVGLKSRASSPQ